MIVEDDAPAMPGYGLLDICIPTCNRAEVIQEALDHLIPEVRRHRIRIFVSDNHSDDNTSLILQSAKATYPELEYQTQEQLLAPDRNFECALKMGSARYIWLMGDGTRIQKGFLPALLAVLQSENHDAVLLNGIGRVREISSQIFTDRDRVLAELGWHLTQMSAFIYSKDLVDSAAFYRFYESNFIQTGIFFDAIAFRPFSVRWLDDAVLGGTRLQKRGSWEPQVFEIFGIRWMNFVLSLPVAYSLESKLACVRSHGVRSELFTARGFRKLRRNGYYDLRSWIRYRRWFPWLTTVPSWMTLLIACLPLRAFWLLEQRVKAVRRTQKK